MSTRSKTVLSLVVWVAAACGEADSDLDASPDPDSAAAPSDAPLAPDAGSEPGFLPDGVGTIHLVDSDFAGPEVGSFAVLRDGAAVPGLELVAEHGQCAIWKRVESGFCESPCEGVCDAEGTCLPWPLDRNAGVITVTGLLGPLTFQPTDTGYRTDTALDESLFATGAAIGVDAPGDEVPGFSLSAVGVAPFDDEIDLITIEDDVDTEVTWTPASSGRVQLALRLGWHGGPFTDMILCEADDVGSLVISGELISQFPYFEGGLFQVPSSIGRFDRDVVTTPDGQVELFVGHMRYIGFMHPFP